MSREPQPRRSAASFSAAPARAKRGVGSRVGLQKAGGRPSAQPSAGSMPGARPPRQAPQSGRRVTGAEQLRRRRRRTLLGILLVVLVLLLGLVLTAKLLFKVGEIRLENLDGTLPADTGIYTEEQILELLGVQMGDDLFGFSAAAKSELLADRLPYLEQVRVSTSLPGTVVVKLQAATERFALQQGGGWLILSDSLKVLRTADELPQGTIELEAAPAGDAAPVAGQYLALQSYNALLDEEENAVDSGEAADVLAQLLSGFAEQGLLDGVTGLSVRDLSDLRFIYEQRVRVELGTVNRLADKLHICAVTLLPTYEESIGAADRGVLEFYQYTGSELRAAFAPGDPFAEEPAADDGFGDPDGMGNADGFGDPDGPEDPVDGAGDGSDLEPAVG